MARPHVDWSKFKVEKSQVVEPDIYLSDEHEDDAYFEIFRQLSHKVAGCRYDIPWGNQAIVAYCKTPESAGPPQAVGIITFCIADETLKNLSLEEAFMSSYFHTISFLFVDINFQRKSVGSRLLTKAIKTIRESGVQRPIHLEGAKLAVKFFKKMGFTLFGKVGKSSRQGSHLFKDCFYMQHQF